MANILRAAAHQYAEEYFALAEQMEETDLHYASVLQTRKLAVSGADVEVTPGGSGKQDRIVAEAFEERVAEDPCFEDLLHDLMDAVAKGYSVVQPIWRTSGTDWDYERFDWIDPRYFVFDRETGKELRLRYVFSGDGQPIPAGQFVVHFPRSKTGLPIRAGLARLAAVAWMSKAYTLKDWLAFAEVYGMPLRVGHFDPNTATQPEIDSLRTALVNLGHDAAAMLPDGMRIDFIDARRPSATGKNVFEGLANYWDAQISKAVLGQTMTTDDGSSKSQAVVHERVLNAYTQSDAKKLMATIRKAVVAPWVAFNFRNNPAVPKIRLSVEPPEDLASFTEALLPWVRYGGLRVAASTIREKFAIEAPEDDDETEILGGAPAAPQDVPVPKASPP
jgi:phage gp29-like protein